MPLLRAQICTFNNDMCVISVVLAGCYSDIVGGLCRPSSESLSAMALACHMLAKLHKTAMWMLWHYFVNCLLCDESICV